MARFERRAGEGHGEYIARLAIWKNLGGLAIAGGLAVVTGGAFAAAAGTFAALEGVGAGVSAVAHQHLKNNRLSKTH